MAHGYLSAQDLRGKSGIEKALEKYLNDKFDKLQKQIQDGFRKTDQKVEEVAVRDLGRNLLPQGQQGLLRGSNQKQITGSAPPLLAGSKFAEIASAPSPKGLLSAEKAIDVEVMGMNPVVGESPIARLPSSDYAGTRGAIDASFVDLGIQRDLPSANDNFFPKQLSPTDGGDGTSQIVQSIDRLTMVTTMLVAATKEQTNQQGMIASAQMQQSEKLARQAKASAEENALEKGGDFSGNTAYSLLGAGGAGGGRSGGGGGPGFGLGGKVLAKNMLRAATKRGAARTGTRLGAALGGKMMGGLGARMGAKLGSKAVGKVAGTAIAKSLGKKIPLVGLGLGAIFAAQRAMQGDFVGAGLELASGAASTVPGIGTAASVGIDAGLAARDMMTPMATGGIVAEPTNALIGEAGKEGVFPLSGAEGKKTFMQFGEGILEAQKRRRRDNARLMAEGLKEYYDNQNGWEKFIEGLVEIFKKLFSKLPDMFNPFADKKGKDGKGNTPSGSANLNLDDVDITATEKSGAIGRVLPTAKGQAPPTATPHNSDPSKASNFGEMRGGRKHMGADIGMDANSPVTAIEDGVVVDAYNSGFGLHGGAVVVKHEDGSAYVYGHVEPNVKKGDPVKAGQKVAKLVYYPGPNNQDFTHLHLERYQTHGDRGSAVDPIAHMAKENINPARVQEALKKDAEPVDDPKSKEQIQALNTMLGDSKKTGEVALEGVGTMKRTSKTNSRGRTVYNTAYTNEAGERISGAEFKEAVTSAYGDDALKVNKASADVASGDRAAASTPAQVTVAAAPQQSSAGGAKSSAPPPAPSHSESYTASLRNLELQRA